MRPALRQGLRLLTGDVMPCIGLGTFHPNGDFSHSAFDLALYLGYRHVDTAATYGTEAAIGEVLKDWFRAGKLKRSDIFLTTKIPPAHLEKHEMAMAAESSLEKLQLNNVDMLLIHSPYAYRYDAKLAKLPLEEELKSRKNRHLNIEVEQMWADIVQLNKDRNISKNLGVSNFNLSQLQRTWNSSSTKPTNVQSECHLYYQQQNIRRFCTDKGIVMTSYAPLGAPTRPKHYFTGIEKSPLDEAVIIDMAKKYKLTEGQILLKFVMQLGTIPIVKSSNEKRLEENINILNSDLTSADMDMLTKLNIDVKHFVFSWAEGHINYDSSQTF